MSDSKAVMDMDGIISGLRDLCNNLQISDWDLFATPVTINSICSVCGRLLTNAYHDLDSQYECRFCPSCFNKLTKEGKHTARCPDHEGHQISKTFLMQDLTDGVTRLLVSCPHRCGSLFSLPNIWDHHLICPKNKMKRQIVTQAIKASTISSDNIYSSPTNNTFHENHQDHCNLLDMEPGQLDQKQLQNHTKEVSNKDHHMKYPNSEMKGQMPTPTLEASATSSTKKWSRSETKATYAKNDNFRQFHKMEDNLHILENDIQAVQLKTEENQNMLESIDGNVKSLYRSSRTDHGESPHHPVQTAEQKWPQAANRTQGEGVHRNLAHTHQTYSQTNLNTGMSECGVRANDGSQSKQNMKAGTTTVAGIYPALPVENDSRNCDPGDPGSEKFPNSVVNREATNLQGPYVSGSLVPVAVGKQNGSRQSNLNSENFLNSRSAGIHQRQDCCNKMADEANALAGGVSHLQVAGSLQNDELHNLRLPKGQQTETHL